jgi:lysyl-tRNA synthetase, class II
MEQVYELGKDFRNEGLSAKHNPEFTMLEWYEAYADYEDIAKELEQLISGVATEVGYQGDIDFSAPWPRISLRDAILDKTGVDVLAHRDARALAAAAEERGIDVDPTETWAQMVDEMLSKHVEPDLIDPTFIVDYPVELSPFAKAQSSPTPSPSSTTPTSSGPASRPSAVTARQATRRPSPTTRPSSRRSSRACLRRAGSASGSTAW